MVGIFKYENGLKFVAVSDSYDSAVEYFFNKFAHDYEKNLSPLEWWENGKKWNNGVPRCYEIKKIEKWG